MDTSDHDLAVRFFAGNLALHLATTQAGKTYNRNCEIMKNPGIFILLFILAGQGISAQSLLPYLGKNGQYGFADETGKVIIAPEFEGRMEVFGPDDWYKDLKKNGEGVRLFRSGVVVPNPRLTMGRAIRCVDVDSHIGRTDTLTGLVVCQQNDRFIFVDLKTGKTVETFNESYLNSQPDWQKGEEISGFNGLVFHFSDGLARVFRPDGSVNFLDTKLNFLLAKDVAAGWIVDEKYMAVADAEGRFGALDRSGREVLPKRFRRVETAGRTGAFIVNNHRYESTPNSGAGLFAAGGKVVLDTVFARIKPVPGGRFIVAQKELRFGVFDLDGREIVAPEAKNIENFNRHTRPLAITWETDRRANILDATGTMRFPKDVQNVRGMTIAGSAFPHYIVADGSKKMVLDTALNLVLEVESAELSLASSEPELLFFAKRPGGSSMLRSDGSVLFSGDFDGVFLERFLTEKGLLRLKKGERQGLAAFDGRMVLPFDFEEFRMETRERDTVLWARPVGSRLFFQYDLAGNKRSEYGLPQADSRSDSPISTGQTMSDGRKKLTLFNGLEVFLPDSLKDCRVLAHWWDMRDRAIVAFGKDKDPAARAVFNEKFEAVLPPGFVAPKEMLGESLFPRLHEYGLIVVKKMLPAPPRVSPKPAAPPKNDQPVRSDKEQEVVVMDAVVEAPPETVRGVDDTSADFEKNGSCGLIDASGNWLMEPVAGVDLLPLSPFVVAEMPAGERNANHSFVEKGIRLHVIAGPLKGTVIEANWLGQDGFSQKNGYNMKVGRIRKGTTRMAEYAYFDWQGRAITDWIFENGPDFLKAKNLVHIWEKGVLGIRQAVINDNGKTIFELGDWMTEDSPRSRGGDNDKWAYLIVQKRRDEILKDTFGRLIPMPKGLMDSTGRVVLSPQFLDLNIWEKDRFLTTKTASGNVVLMTMDGRTIHEFKPGKSSILMQHIGRDPKGDRVGPIAVWTENETVLIDDNNAVIRHFELPFGREVLSEELSEQFVVLIKNNKKVWADFRSGKVFAA